jgi:uncharacterized phiE125 gp8 family phage protein
MELIQTVAPASEPLTLAEAKLHLRVEHTGDDSLITALIVAARQQAEALTARSLITQQWRQDLEDFAELDKDNGISCDGRIRLQCPPLASVQGITYLDTDGVRQTLDASAYQVVTGGGYVMPDYGTTWPSCRMQPGSVQISYTAGYGAASAVPQPIKAWMLLAIGAWYTQREALIAGISISELPRAFWGGLLDAYTITTF